MKSIVTGGAGFIGSHIVDKLIELGHEVVVIDDQSATAHEQFYFNDKATYYGISINNPNVATLFQDVDYVFHLAAESRIQPALENPELAIQTNVLGTCKILQYALDYGIKRVMYSSTSSAYGLNGIMPLVETMKKDCLNPYSITKIAGEDFCKMYNNLYGLETVIFRYFNVYGERQPTKGQYAPVIGLFQKQFANKHAMTVVGDGRQTRDYIHVSDVVNANVSAMTAPKEACGEIFNIGTSVNYSVLDLVKMIGGDTGSYIHMPARLGEARHTKADISKANRILNWKPKVKLEDWLNDV
jgi:UDP-glucose 4-epimerase